MIDHQECPTTAGRPTLFARQARAALEMHIAEVRTPGAHWSLGTNVAWVRFRRGDGLYGYFALRRHLDWLSGEAGLSREPCQLGELCQSPGAAPATAVGYRVRLGELLCGRDRWWSAGRNGSELGERLRYLALQLGVKGGSHFRRWPGGER